MTVAEWIKLWDSINVSTIPFVYYYKNKKYMKYKLYDIHTELRSIKLSCSYEDLTEYHINIYHETLNNEDFTETEDSFYNKLHLEIPENSTITLINMYIE